MGAEKTVEGRIKRFETFIEGRPAPQGSKSYKGNQRFVESSKYLPAWRKAVKNGVAAANDGSLFEVPVALKIVFYMERPKNPKFHRPGTPPDLDKLVRAVGDSLTGTIIKDDALIVELWASLHWAKDKTGCFIRVSRAL